MDSHATRPGSAVLPGWFHGEALLMQPTLPQPLPVDPAWFSAEQMDRLGRAPAAVVFSPAERRVMRKKKAIRPSVWAERHRVLPDSASYSGKWRNSTVPYLPGIMDASFFNSVQEIVICAAPQTGKTEVNYTCLGYAVDRRPGNALVVFPDQDQAQDNCNDRIQPMFEDSPRLRRYLTGRQDDQAAKRLRLKNAIIYMAWANSASKLANKPLPYVVLDEEDKYPVTANKKEGSPADLAKKRTRTFAHMRKIWRTSSPTVEAGPIWMALTTECQLVFDYFVQCPHCGAYQKMVFTGIRWPEDVRDPLRMKAEQDCWYECRGCDVRWDDGDRDLAVRAGEWRDRDKGRGLDTALRSLQPVSIGFHIPSWLSPFVHLWEVAQAWLETDGGRNKIKLRDFRNGHAAEPWQALSAERSEDRILSLADERPRGVVPGGGRVACLLAGVDTQDDGFYYEIRAFGYGLERESWGVREGKVPTFEALAQVLWQDEYRDADDQVYRVLLTLQDAMGHRTAEVYDFCRQHRGMILPTMGKQTMATPHTYSKIEFYPGTKKPIPGGLQLLRFDTNYFKNQLAGLLEIEPGDPGCWHYHGQVTRDWAFQMTVEGINEKGFWDNPQGKANHAWDCSTLLLVAHDVRGVAFFPKPDPDAAPAKPAKRAVQAPAKINLW